VDWERVKGKDSIHTKLTVNFKVFSAGASRLWNTMPLEEREAEALATFRRQLKTVLFTRAYGQ
jgi:hypothetical protein